MAGSLGQADGPVFGAQGLLCDADAFHGAFEQGEVEVREECACGGVRSAQVELEFRKIESIRIDVDTGSKCDKEVVYCCKLP